MRALLVAVMATVGLVAALASALLWTVGRDLLDEERFTDDAVVALRAPEGRDAIGARVVAAVGVPDDPAASFLSRAAIDALVRRVVFSPAFAAALAPELARAHREFLDLSGEPVTIGLGGVRELVAEELAGIDQSLAVPAEGAPSLPDIQLATGIEAPGIPGARIADRTPAIVGLLAVAAAALVVIAIALAAAGVLLVISAAVLRPRRPRSPTPAA